MNIPPPRSRKRWNKAKRCRVCKRSTRSHDAWYCCQDCRIVGMSRIVQQREIQLSTGATEHALALACDALFNAMPWERAAIEDQFARSVMPHPGGSYTDPRPRRHSKSANGATNGSTDSETQETPSHHDGTPGPRPNHHNP